MKGKIFKKTASAVMAVALIGGAMPTTIGNVELFKPSLVAEAATEYDLKICGTQVTSSNKGDILGNGIFEFDEASKTLTIKDSYDWFSNDESPMISTCMEGLTINATDYIKLDSNSAVLSIYGNGKVTVKGDSSMEIYSHDLEHDTFTDGSSVWLFDDATLCIKDCSIGIMRVGFPGAETDNAKLIVDNSEGWIGSFYYLHNDVSTVINDHVDLIDCYIDSDSNCEINNEAKQICTLFSTGDGFKSGFDFDQSSRVDSVSVSLPDGNLDINYYAYLSNSRIAKVVIDGPNGEIVIPKQDFYKYVTSSRCDANYKLSYSLNATQAGEDVTLKFYDSEGNPIDTRKLEDGHLENIDVTYSINKYISQVKNNAPYLPAKTNTLIAALDNYCKAAENFFNGASNDISGIDLVTAEDFEDYAITKSGMASAKMALILDSETSIRVKYTGAETTATLTDKKDNETTLTKTEAGYFIIPNISADKLADDYKLKIGNTTFNFSGLTYGYIVMNGGSSDAALQKLVKALYVYAQAAIAYKA